MPRRSPRWPRRESCRVARSARAGGSGAAPCSSGSVAAARQTRQTERDMSAPSHQTVRLARGRHASRQIGVCVMELASMLADEPFSDRARSISPTIGAMLRTYNDGLDDDRRQDLYAVAAAIVGTASTRAVERERISRCLEFA